MCEVSNNDGAQVENCERCETSLEGSGDGFFDIRYCDDCYDEIRELAGESNHKEVDIQWK